MESLTQRASDIARVSIYSEHEYNGSPSIIQDETDLESSLSSEIDYYSSDESFPGKLILVLVISYNIINVPSSRSRRFRDSL